MGQSIKELPAITINKCELEIFHQFVYLGSNITTNLSLKSEINRCIEQAKRVWCNNKLTIHIKVAVDITCIISRLLYSSKSWTLLVSRKKKTPSTCVALDTYSGYHTEIESQVLISAQKPRTLTVLRQCRLH